MDHPVRLASKSNVVLCSRSREWVGRSGGGGEAVWAIGVGGEVAGVRPRDEVDVREVCKREGVEEGDEVDSEHLYPLINLYSAPTEENLKLLFPLN